MIDLKKPRLTKKYGGGFGLVKVKDDEQEVESPYPNTLKAILECFNRLGELENAIESGELVPVVHGEWEIMLDYPGNEPVYICSNCEETWVLNYGTPSENNMNYCPRCSAKMDGKEHENEAD